MELFEIFLLPALIILGIVTSYYDIRHKKIRNKHLIVAAIYCFIVYVAVMIIYKLTAIGINYKYLLDILINTAIALAFGIFAWQVKIWTAADAKLFTVYSFLIPLTFYSRSYIPYFPSLVLLINTFVPFAIYSFFFILFFTKVKTKKESLKNLKGKDILLLFLNIFWILWIPRLLNITPIKFNFLAMILVMFFVIWLLQKVFGNKMILVSFLLCILRVIFDFEYVSSFRFIKQFLTFGICIFLLFLVLIIGSDIFSKKIKVEELKPGMILEETIYSGKNGKFKAVKLQKFIGIEKKDVKKVLVLEQPAEGLTEKDIQIIKRLHKEGKLEFKEILIRQTLPFAPFMFFGFILTWLAKGNFLLLFKFFLGH